MKRCLPACLPAPLFSELVRCGCCGLHSPLSLPLRLPSALLVSLAWCAALCRHCARLRLLLAAQQSQHRNIATQRPRKREPAHRRSTLLVVTAFASETESSEIESEKAAPERSTGNCRARRKLAQRESEESRRAVVSERLISGVASRHVALLRLEFLLHGRTKRRERPLRQSLFERSLSRSSSRERRRRRGAQSPSTS